MLTKQLYALNTTLSTIPATKKQPTSTTSAHFGSISASKRHRSLVAKGKLERGSSVSGERVISLSGVE